MKNRYLRVVAWLCAGGLLAGCPGGGGGQLPAGEKAKIKGDRTLVAHSEGVEPLWIQECPAKTEHLLVFCGDAHDQASQQTACAEAYGNALGKLRRYIGQKVDAALVPDAKGGYSFQIKSAESQPMTIHGAWEDQRWAEEYSSPAGHTHDCYQMITYPVLQYELLVKAASDATLGRVLKAGELHQEGKQARDDGRFAEAAAAFDRALSLLQGLKEPVSTPSGLNSTLLAEQVSADLKSVQKTAGDTAKTALVVLRLTLDGTVATDGPVGQALLGRVKSWLSARGVEAFPGTLEARELQSVLDGNRSAATQVAARKGAGWVLVIDVRSDFKVKEPEAFYAYASGVFRMVRCADGRELGTVDLGPRKFGHPLNREDAVRSAVEKLRDEQLQEAVKNALAKM